MSFGTFTLIRNEIAWIEQHIENVAPHLDEMVFFEGDSDDGTHEVLHKATQKYPHIKVICARNPIDLCEDYTRLSNEAMHTLKTDWGMFLHPDMWVENPEQFKVAGKMQGAALSVHMTSYAGEPGGQLFKITAGRSRAWKNIYRLRNPDLGAHYHGHYGAANEDVYFSQITGDQHDFYGPDFGRYPYEVADSGLRVHHFSDVRPYERRLSRMATCLRNQNCPDSIADELARTHPRVTLVPTEYFKLTPCEDPRRVPTNA